MKIKTNDIIKFSSYENSCIVRIQDILEYENILEYLNKEDLDSIIPGIEDIQTAYEHYNKFYSNRKLKKHKMLAIKFKLIQ